MADLAMPLPAWHSAILADVIRWYRLTGSWELAIATVLVGLLDLLACFRGLCAH